MLSQWSDVRITAHSPEARLSMAALAADAVILCAVAYSAAAVPLNIGYKTTRE
jgi:hypothetical protein